MALIYIFLTIGHELLVVRDVRSVPAVVQNDSRDVPTALYGPNNRRLACAASQTRNTVPLTEPNSFIAASALREGSIW